MDIGKNIRENRTRLHLTQGELAEKLNVTFQAVSRWENNEVEPGLDTLNRMSEIFGISVDELMGREVKVPEPVVVEKEVIREVPKEPERKMVGVCALCSRFMYEDEKLVKSGTGQVHEACLQARNKEIEEGRKRKAQEQLNLRKRAGIRKRNKAFTLGGVFGPLVGIVMFLIMFAIKDSAFSGQVWQPILIGIACAVVIFCLIFCCVVDNTTVALWWMDIASWGIKKMPGVIFSFTPDGIVFLIVTKILLFFLSLLLFAATVGLATIVMGAISLFVFPFALKTSLDQPEKSVSTSYVGEKK